MADCSQLSVISNGFSTLSLCSWICAQLPQIYTNFKNKSAEGISPTFLILWFLGDFLSFTSCLMNDVVLKFQVYLSLFFLANDITLCFQYYYYNSVYPRTLYTSLNAVTEETAEPTGSDVVGDSEVYKTSARVIHVRNDSTSLDSLRTSNNSPTTSYNSTAKKVVAASLISGSNAFKIFTNELSKLVTREDNSLERLGLFLAWLMTVVYMSSRCPQLYKNYKRKSVEGINPVLFGAALIGNITYTLSILSSCQFVYSDGKTEFFMKELPYILGSSGTVVFDVMYFYQRYIYRDAGRNTSFMNLENWEE